ncbi:hypothetical protein CC1G_09691 [Coprinopsis cinerea okayama7|uniref:SnoaL-like domain-containing protein n=1 Tax=Coprinopsis cinerea (strain Okayama-7 / 130 / ATCC MYA-4618 / FGSC 9003) TaxID=240176 RepID=A8NJC2_COPC7|nr:hypothetical protein CC1G_09691 [Coprinopsis cinerea okayama7\|eukprot:XP_001834191.2 hypothetical protein CC1G_09691 [Coprinopsis cinerea okayama7\
MKIPDDIQISTTLPPDEIEVHKNLLANILTDYENKNPLIAHQHFAEDATIEIPEVGTLVGRQAIDEYFRWTYQGIAGFEWSIQSVNILVNQVIFTADVTCSFAQENQVPLRMSWAVSMILEPQTRRIKNIRVGGDILSMIETASLHAGPVRGISRPWPVSLD